MFSLKTSIRLLCLILALPALGADFQATTTSTTSDVTQPGPGTTIYYNYTAATDPDNMVKTSACPRLTVSVIPDTTGGGDSTLVHFYACPFSGVTAGDHDQCYQILNDTDGDGVKDSGEFDGVTANLTGFVRNGIAALDVDIQSQTGGNQSRIMLVCGK